VDTVYKWFKDDPLKALLVCLLGAVAYLYIDIRTMNEDAILRCEEDKTALQERVTHLENRVDELSKVITKLTDI
jgi:hypothetical protein